ncbi:MAG: glycosyltransferase family 4 protein [Kineosporiaceae bacterium]
MTDSATLSAGRWWSRRHDRLRIAMVAPPWYSLPPRGYGGVEAVVADLVDLMVLRGHHVTLIASGDHSTAAHEVHRAYDEPPSERLGTPQPEVVQAAAAAAIVAELDVDLVHDHSLAGPLMARGRHVPTLATVHSRPTGDYAEYYRWLDRTVGFVAVSDSQRSLLPEAHWVGRVHNAIDVPSFPFREAKDDYVLWIGRFVEMKAPHLAIDAARAAGRRIVLAGKCSEPRERAFFEAEVAPRLGPDVEYVGEADAALKRELYSRARCLVFPLQWEEPFGMVMAEAMACGTPVVALRRGAVPEVVEHGVGGLVVDDLDAMAGAIHAADDLDPEGCRRLVQERFDLPVMADGYERVYRDVLDGGMTDELTRRAARRAARRGTDRHSRALATADLRA